MNPQVPGSSPGRGATECAHEWTGDVVVAADEARVVRDANGNVLQDGNTVIVIKDLEVKRRSLVVEVGTTVKDLRPVASAAGPSSASPL